MEKKQNDQTAIFKTAKRMIKCERRWEGMTKSQKKKRQTVYHKQSGMMMHTQQAQIQPMIYY